MSASAETSYRILDFSDLKGWASDDHQAALDVFRTSCLGIVGPEWAPVCDARVTPDTARQFFETHFRPVLIEDGTPALFTGYFEPELNGATAPDDRFRFPLYRYPPEARSKPWFTRREIEDSGVLDGRGLEIAWLEDPVDRFFLHVQGSGRIKLPDGRNMRVGYAGTNGRQYQSIGKEIVRQGFFTADELTSETLKDWIRANPVQGRELMFHNPAYVFFREVSEIPADKGPIGAMGLSVTDGRSVAVDPGFVPLGAPVWVEKAGLEPIHRLFIAQDTGSAIKGAQRADIFFGTGQQAGRTAGELSDPGRMVVLLPLGHPLVVEGAK